MHAYNLFRRKDEKTLYCAVPEDRIVPEFLTAKAWEFGGKVEEPTTTLVGLDLRAAAKTVRFNGFYLFQAFPRH